MNLNPLHENKSNFEHSIQHRIRQALFLECTAIKAGNVHPSASFHDLKYPQFVDASVSISERIAECLNESVGVIVLRSVQAMMECVGTNTSLGTILLIGPLAVAVNRLENENKAKSELPTSITETLSQLDAGDSRCIYEAIRTAKPGGLGESRLMDIQQVAPARIVDAMQTAADWDDIALQYATNFELVFGYARRIMESVSNGTNWLATIRKLQIEILSERVDSLIVRKGGMDFAKQVQTRATRVLSSGCYGSQPYETAWDQFDRFLRDDQHVGNPGTTADLITAALFLSIR